MYIIVGQFPHPKEKGRGLNYLNFSKKWNADFTNKKGRVGEIGVCSNKGELSLIFNLTKPF